MNRIKHIIVDFKLVLHVISTQVLYSRYLYLNVLLFFVVIFFLQWVFNFDDLSQILFSDNGLSGLERLDVLADALINLFRYGNDLIPLSLITISLLQSLALVLIIKIHRSTPKNTKNQDSKVAAGSLGLAALGAGCVACGGSLLAPILGFFAVTVSTSFARRIGDVLLLAAVVISYIALSKISFKAASLYAQEKNHK